MIDSIKKIVAPLQRRIMMMVTRGVLKNLNSSKPLQRVQMTGYPEEVLDNLEYVEPYGFTSAPIPGAETVAVFMGGNRDHGVVLSVGDRRYRLTDLVSGDVAMYHQDGTKIILKGSGKLQIVNPAGNELIAVLSELLQLLINARTTTTIGPQPLFDVTGADTFAAIKAKVDSFKV